LLLINFVNLINETRTILIIWSLVLFCLVGTMLEPSGDQEDDQQEDDQHHQDDDQHHPAPSGG
jgi:hypothetical protein